MKLVGISGLAGSGKSTAAKALIAQGFIEVSLADPLKRICKEVFNFSDEQLWGPSEKRNEPDTRYKRPYTPEEEQQIAALPKEGSMATMAEILDMHRDWPLTRWLTPRHALQQLGTEWGRACYGDVWVDYAIRVAKAVLEGDGYTAQRGLFRGVGPRARGVVVADVRFKNEVAAIRAADGFLVRIVRPTPGLTGAAGAHVSETEQAEIPDSAFDAVVQNTRSLEDLAAFMTDIADTVFSREQRALYGRGVEALRVKHHDARIAPFNKEKENIPPYKRGVVDAEAPTDPKPNVEELPQDDDMEKLFPKASKT